MIQLSRVHYFVHEVISIFIHEDFVCYPKKFRATISKNLIFQLVHDTGLVKYRVYNKMYTRTRMVSIGVYKNLHIQPLVKSPEKYRGS